MLYADNGNYQRRFLLSFLFMFGPGVEPSPLLLLPFIGLLYQMLMAMEELVE
jgi:hypothetical protein